MSAKKPIGIVRFLGSNCDYDVWNALELIGRKPQWCWFEDRFNVTDYEALIIPGGFSYGDYLRCGALAARSPVMESVREAAKKGTPILGICNGFQILCESGLLPGVLLRNKNQRFIDSWVDLCGQKIKGPWSEALGAGSGNIVPIAHGEGRFFADDSVINKLFDQDRILATYTEETNLNGSVRNIAGILNETFNVCALMPHPERAMDVEIHGSDDGYSFFKGFA